MKFKEQERRRSALARREAELKAWLAKPQVNEDGEPSLAAKKAAIAEKEVAILRGRVGRGVGA